MNQLILFVGEGVRLDRRRVRHALGEILGTEGVEERDGTGWVIQGHLAHRGDSAIIRLVDDEETISITGEGDASLHAVVELQKRLGQEQRLVDTDCTFDIPLHGITTADELRGRIAEARKAALADEGEA